MKKLIALLTILSIVSCNQTKKSDYSKKNTKDITTVEASIPPGKNCLKQAALYVIMLLHLMTKE